MNRITALLVATVVAVAISPAAVAQAPPAKNFVAHLTGDEEVSIMGEILRILI